MFVILSGDGGGIRGVLTARLIQRLSDELADEGIDLLGSVDMFTGASTGGILAGGYAYGFTAAEAVSIYATRGDEIFADSVWDDIADLGGLEGAEFSTEPLRKVLEGYFGDTRLGDLKKKIHIPTCQAERDQQINGGTVLTSGLKFYHNWKGSSDLSAKLVDVLLYTSAAPTYFPMVDGHFDGGMAANNPTDCSIAFAKRCGVATDDMVVLSVGTGVNPHPIRDGKKRVAIRKKDEDPPAVTDWGLRKWLKAGLIPMMMELPQMAVHYRCDAWLNDRNERGKVTEERYHRIQAILPRKIDLSSSSEVPALIEIANNVDLRPATAWLSKKLKPIGTGEA